jgi:hypothetical protein
MSGRRDPNAPQQITHSTTTTINRHDPNASTPQQDNINNSFHNSGKRDPNGSTPQGNNHSGGGGIGRSDPNASKENPNPLRIEIDPVTPTKAVLHTASNHESTLQPQFSPFRAAAQVTTLLHLPTLLIHLTLLTLLTLLTILILVSLLIL